MLQNRPRVGMRLPLAFCFPNQRLYRQRIVLFSSVQDDHMTSETELKAPTSFEYRTGVQASGPLSALVHCLQD